MKLCGRNGHLPRTNPLNFCYIWMRMGWNTDKNMSYRKPSLSQNNEWLHDCVLCITKKIIVCKFISSREFIVNSIVSISRPSNTLAEILQFGVLSSFIPRNAIMRVNIYLSYRICFSITLTWTSSTTNTFSIEQNLFSRAKASIPFRLLARSRLIVSTSPRATTFFEFSHSTPTFCFTILWKKDLFFYKTGKKQFD